MTSSTTMHNKKTAFFIKVTKALANALTCYFSFTKNIFCDDEEEKEGKKESSLHFFFFYSL